MARLSRKFSAISGQRFSVCVVGSGPAGFYTADKMLKVHQGAEVDIVDRLPTPFGLVRTGVAPDHPETKIVTNQFSHILHNQHCSFFGNVSLGSSVTLLELQQVYDVVVLAYGAESDKVLGIPGENLAGIHPSREFVWWYNGHPDCTHFSPDLNRSDTAIILGQGNVALDVARILLKPIMELETTDITGNALAALERSSIRKVYLVGRRGPVQAACTAKELREILGITNTYTSIKVDDLQKTQSDEDELKKNRSRRRVYELFSKASSNATHCCSANKRELHFVFFRRPVAFLESHEGNGTVGGIRFEKTVLKESPHSQNRILVGTEQFEELQCGLVLKSIGYRSLAVPGLPFDSHKGIVPNVKGRVLRSGSDHELFEKGLYVCGWLKRGPSGIIATNLYCAEETVASICEDLEKGMLVLDSRSPKPGREGLQRLLHSRGIKAVSCIDWEKIDCEERRLGALRHKPREKLTSWDELLRVATQ